MAAEDTQTKAVCQKFRFGAKEDSHQFVERSSGSVERKALLSWLAGLEHCTPEFGNYIPRQMEAGNHPYTSR